MDIQDQPLQAQPSVPVVAASAQETVAQAPAVNAAAVSATSQATAITPVEPATEPTIQLNAIPTEEHQTAFRSHKSLIIGVILAAIVVVSGLSVFIGFNNSSNQYQGFLQKIETETEKLNAGKASAEQDVSGDAQPTSDLPDVTGAAESASANSGAALPELGEDTLVPADIDSNVSPELAPAEDEGLAR